MDMYNDENMMTGKYYANYIKCMFVSKSVILKQTSSMNFRRVSVSDDSVLKCLMGCKQNNGI